MKFTKDHEWVKIEGDIATIGITKFAADALGELVYVELPKVGNQYKQSEPFAVVESSKSASDVYLPMQGKIVEINNNLIIKIIQEVKIDIIKINNLNIII